MNSLPIPHELLWIEGPTGYLAASFHRPGFCPRPVPAVLMCHGFTGHRIEAHRLFVEAAQAFAASGVAALRFDFRGSGESQGAFADMTVEGEIQDALAALEYLMRRPDVDASRVAVLGLSLGGAVAACVAGRRPDVRALVLWAAVADLAQLAQRFASEHAPPRLPDGTFDIGGLAVGPNFIRGLENVRPLNEVTAFSGPVLLVHGSEDAAVPIAHAEAYKQALGSRCTLHIIAGADHVFSSVPWQSDAIEVTARFLVSVL
ncbi:MAG: alpha/beta fold hydrolase [Armatimonadetes bacterium]|nr:alpha/beta fold hydrolase [Armatimonadota bacterium]